MTKSNLAIFDPAKTSFYCLLSSFRSRGTESRPNLLLHVSFSPRFSPFRLGGLLWSATHDSRITIHESRPQLIANTPRIAPNRTLNSSPVTRVTARGGMCHRYFAWESRSVLGMLPKAISGPASISLRRYGVLGFWVCGQERPAGVAWGKGYKFLAFILSDTNFGGSK